MVLLREISYCFRYFIPVSVVASVIALFVCLGFAAIAYLCIRGTSTVSLLIVCNTKSLTVSYFQARPHSCQTDDGSLWCSNSLRLSPSIVAFSWRIFVCDIFWSFLRLHFCLLIFPFWHVQAGIRVRVFCTVSGSIKCSTSFCKQCFKHSSKADAKFCLNLSNIFEKKIWNSCYCIK